MSVVGGWEVVRSSVRDEVGRSAYDAWFRNLQARTQGDHLVLVCPDRFSREWIQRRYGAALQRAARSYKSVAYEIQGGEPSKPVEGQTSENSQKSANSGELNSANRAPQTAAPSPRRTANRDVSFDTFVTGANNALALEAARAMARGTPGRCTPLLLAGASGAGKTHLCRSILRTTDAATVYRSSEEFTSEVTTAMRRGSMDTIRHRYRRANNLFILEDIQFLQGKRATQIELFHTLDHLIQQGKSVVLTCDRPPAELDLDPKLISRMSSGLIARIGEVDAPMRKEILRSKAAYGGVRVPDECLEVLSNRPVRNVSDLISGLNQVVARSSLLRQEISLDLVYQTLADVDLVRGPYSIEEIMQTTAKAYSIGIDELCGRSRRQRLVRPRHFAMYLCRRYTDASLKDIGRAFNRDHTSVMHAIRSVEQKTATQPQLRYEFESLAARFAGGAPALEAEQAPRYSARRA